MSERERETERERQREESDVSDNEFVTMSSGNKTEGSYRVWHACLCVCVGSP
jgi:hypothetical protein